MTKLSKSDGSVVMDFVFREREIGSIKIESLAYMENDREIAVTRSIRIWEKDIEKGGYGKEIFRGTIGQLVKLVKEREKDDQT